MANKTPTRCQIEILENNTLVYLPGEKVVAKFKIDDKTIEQDALKTIEISLIGVSKVNSIWVPTTRDRFLHIKKVATVKSNNVRFEFSLPAKLPASYKSQRGSVSYSIEARARCGDDDGWIRARKEFFVNYQLDLNRYPMLKQPVEASETFTFGYGPCLSSPITVQFGIDKSIFINTDDN